MGRAELSIREADKNDLSMIIKLKSELFKYESRIDNLLAKDRKARMYDNIYNKMSFFNKDFKFYVAEADRRVIGFVSGWVESTPPIFKLRRMGIIGDLYVKGAYRGTGTGTELSNAILDWFKKKKIKWVKVMIYTGNNPSKEFWKSQGFEDYIDEYRMIL
ncbi:GNAT family N-acetyltransferase [Candidatus Woesearchaeota archaeon]|nr:GNAT family N-acetyltransferase [Candidatus Woesearchaeota archaeon]